MRIIPAKGETTPLLLTPATSPFRTLVLEVVLVDVHRLRGFRLGERQVAACPIPWLGHNCPSLNARLVTGALPLQRIEGTC